ncbi:MAG: hypothetical protein JWQ81_2794 [Amycolatopsis sp.]|jgi:acyl carrier protein|uniref:acyl carrier protein n=1 Tax=Amycolatopsis sp. TaxID=37632 RepID=UPI002629FD22|nr:acyl carrier protein [Amycolatopsis sp.]MCU1682055.1 hypothetical protein [Amycolatopsis sp.]
MDITLNADVIELFAAKAELEVSDLVLDQTLEEAGLDSLTLMEISLVMQKRHSVAVAEGELSLSQTVAEAVEYLSGKLH